ncbi:hypothetical protein GCM10009745_69990 [Kribbella yunnanensis]|uniref:DUF695 domain-containing protein n=1 Tax=Kribbella yunnanensis TaxID=190194 RepID=A0ABP4UV33_9ACTN
MSSDDNVFLDVAVNDLAAWLPAALGARHLTVDWTTEGQHLFAVAAETVDGELALLLSPNDYGDVDPEPEDMSGIDDYPADLHIRLVGKKNEETQQREGRAIFDRLVAARPDVPMLLVHNLSRLVAAHLPDVGTHVFEESISPDYPDVETWRPWVRGWRDRA